MTRRDSPLVNGIFPSQEKGRDMAWWNEKGKRGGDRAHVREISHTAEEKSAAHERERRYEKRGEAKKVGARG